MRDVVRYRVKAFRKALELAADGRAKECSNMPAWKEDLERFPHGSCELASNCLAQYLKDKESCYPCIIFMNGNNEFRQHEQSSVHSHVIVMMDGVYIDLTLDQFDEYQSCILDEPIESDGILGQLLRKIREYEGEIKTRDIDIERFGLIYNWLRNTADEVLAENPEFQEMERSIAECRGKFFFG